MKFKLTSAYLDGRDEAWRLSPDGPRPAKSAHLGDRPSFSRTSPSWDEPNGAELRRALDDSPAAETSGEQPQ